MKKIELNKKEYTVKELRQIVQDTNLKASDKVKVVGEVEVDASTFQRAKDNLDRWFESAAGKGLNSSSDPEPMHTVKEWQAMGKCPSDSQIQASHARKELEALLSVSSVAIDQPSFGVQTMIQTLLVDEICGQVQSRLDLVRAINKYLSTLDADKS